MNTRAKSLYGLGAAAVAIAAIAAWNVPHERGCQPESPAPTQPLPMNVSPARSVATHAPHDVPPSKVVVKDGRLTADVANVPMRDFLQQLSHAAGATVSIHAAEARDGAITSEVSLMRALDSKDAAQRAAAVEQLIAQRIPAATSALARAIGDDAAEVRSRAIAVAAMQHVSVAIEELARVARADPAPEVRLAALQALKQRGDGDALRHAAQYAVVDPDPYVQSEARELLATFDAAARGADAPPPVVANESSGVPAEPVR